MDIGWIEVHAVVTCKHVMTEFLFRNADLPGTLVQFFFQLIFITKLLHTQQLLLLKIELAVV